MSIRKARPPADAQDTAYHDPLDVRPLGQAEDIGPPLPAVLDAICIVAALVLVAIAAGLYMPEIATFVRGLAQ